MGPHLKDLLEISWAMDSIGPQLLKKETSGSLPSISEPVDRLCSGHLLTLVSSFEVIWSDRQQRVNHNIIHSRYLKLYQEYQDILKMVTQCVTGRMTQISKQAKLPLLLHFRWFTIIHQL